MLKNNKKESWEWRCFYKDTKIKNNILCLIDFTLPKPKTIHCTDQYIIMPKLSHNIKLRKIQEDKQEELHIKSIIETQNNIFKFSKKTKFSLPIIHKDLLKLMKFKILHESDKVEAINSAEDILKINKNEYLLSLVKKKIVRYNIKKNISKLKKDIRLEIAEIYINNNLHKTISLKCTSINIITEFLNKIDMLGFERTNYVNYIKNLESK